MAKLTIRLSDQKHERLRWLAERLPSWLPVLGLLLLTGCTGLRPLPSPAVEPCEHPSTLPTLWACLNRTDREVGIDVGAAQPRESAYRSTMRVVNGDLGRKLGDQKAGKACGGDIPPGFVSLDEPAPAPDRAPLKAYYRPPQPGRPTVIIVHGLYDSKHSRYVRLTAAFLAGRDFGVLVPDMRFHGCLLQGWLPTLGPEEAKDLAAWSGWLRERNPGSPVGLLGFSLGSLDVVHALALDPTGEVFRAGGVAISPPASLPDTLARLDDPPSLTDQGLQSLFRAFFQNALLTRMEALHVQPIPPRRLKERPFSRFLAWLAGQNPPFPSGTTPAEIISAADPGPVLARVRRPLLLLASRRDPIFAEGALSELRKAQTNPWVHLIETTDGGHIGIEGTYPRWTAAILDRFFSASPGTTPQ